MLKIAVFAPTPKARESTATIVKPGLFQSTRSPYRISCNSVVIKTPSSGSYRIHIPKRPQRGGTEPRCSSDPLPASPGCQSLFLLRPWRYDTVGARIGDRLAEVLVLVPEKEADGIFLGHIPAEQFHRRLQVGVRESCDGYLQVCVGGLQRFLQFFRLDGLCSAPAAPAPTGAGKRSHEQAVLRHDQVEDVANGTHTLTGLPVVFPHHDPRQAGELVGQRPCLLGQGRLRGLRAQRSQTEHRRYRDRARNRSRSNRSHRHLLFSCIQIAVWSLRPLMPAS